MNFMKELQWDFGYLFLICQKQEMEIATFIMSFLKIDMLYLLFLMKFLQEFIVMRMKIYIGQLQVILYMKAIIQIEKAHMFYIE